MARDSLIVVGAGSLVRRGGGSPGAGAAGALAAPAVTSLVEGAVAVYGARQETRRFRAACRTVQHTVTERRRASEAALAAGVECVRALAAVAPQLTPAAQVALVERFDPVALVAAGLRPMFDPCPVPDPDGLRRRR
jgi:hypothetical protein